MPKPRILRPPYALSLPDLIALPEPDWLIEGLVQERALLALVGPSQSFKSFLALDWALHIAYGLPWHGHPVRQGPVFYIASEGGGGIRKRVEAWLQTHPACDPASCDINFRTRSVNLMDVDSLGQLQREIIKWRPEGVSFMAIDTLARAMHGDENSVEAMSHLVANVEEIQERHRSAVGLVHHTGHKNKERGRGSSALPGAVDVEFVLARDKRNGTFCTRLSNTKQKDEECARPMTLHLEKIELPVDRHGRERSSLAITKVGTAWDTLGTNERDRVVKFYRDHPTASVREVADSTGVSRSSVHRLKLELFPPNQPRKGKWLGQRRRS